VEVLTRRRLEESRFFFAQKPHASPILPCRRGGFPRLRDDKGNGEVPIDTEHAEH
jgi:hypothetical protein